LLLSLLLTTFLLLYSIVGALAVAFHDIALVAAGAGVLLIAVLLLLTSYYCSVPAGLSDCGCM
jgi:hypothetical protein